MVSYETDYEVDFTPLVISATGNFGVGGFSSLVTSTEHRIELRVLPTQGQAVRISCRLIFTSPSCLGNDSCTALLLVVPVAWFTTATTGLELLMAPARVIISDANGGPPQNETTLDTRNGRLATFLGGCPFPLTFNIFFIQLQSTKKILCSIQLGITLLFYYGHQ